MWKRLRPSLIGFFLLLILAGGIYWWRLAQHIGRDGAAPPRAAASALPAPKPSTIALPVRIPIDKVEAALNKALPVPLWSIDKPGSTCVKPTRVRIFDGGINVTPRIKCRIVGSVKRGKLTLSGSGNAILVAMPVDAVLQVREVAKVSDIKPVNASTQITALLVPKLTREGHLKASLKLKYNWRTEPEVLIMGQRIRLTDKADEKLAPILAKAEEDLERELSGLSVREELQNLWRQGFTVESLNRQNPEAWLRITPLGLAGGRVAIEGRNLRVDAMLTASAEVKLGAKPARPTPTPLPRLGLEGEATDLRLNAPVLAEYTQLEPVIGKALNKLAIKPIVLADGNAVRVRFGTPRLYATQGGRLALGLEISARGTGGLIDTKGLVWLTARPETAPNSERVLIRDIQLAVGNSRDVQLPLLIDIAQSEMVRATIEDALAQDFSRDYLKLMIKIDVALQKVRIGPFRLAAELNSMSHGKVQPLGQGLYMPITASGTARLDYIGQK